MKVAVALDLPTPEDNLKLVAALGELESVYKIQTAVKVGLNSFIAGGTSFLKEVQKSTFEVVLDLKLHDIPNTMATAAERVADLGVSMFTIHASAGPTAVRAVKKALTGPKRPHPPKILAVTALTSMDDGECKTVYRRTAKKVAKNLFVEALHAGADGVVCSPMELPYLRGWAKDGFKMGGPPPKFLTFVPGIELQPRKDDQKRKGGLKEVIEGEADYIVVGRPIYTNPDPANFLHKLLLKIQTLETTMMKYKNELAWSDPEPRKKEEKS